MINRVNNTLLGVTKEYNNIKAELIEKEDNLWLHTDWAALKEKGITNQRTREGWVRTKTRLLRDKKDKIELQKEHLERRYQILLKEMDSGPMWKERLGTIQTIGTSD